MPETIVKTAAARELAQAAGALLWALNHWDAKYFDDAHKTAGYYIAAEEIRCCREAERLRAALAAYANTKGNP